MIKYITGDKFRYILIHILAQKLCEDISNTVLKVHVLTGCDATSKVGRKAAAVKANNHLLTSFRENRTLNFLAPKQV